MPNQAAFTVNISQGLKRLKNLKKGLRKEEVAAGISEAINATLQKGRAKVVAVVGSTHNIPGRELGKIRVRQSKAGSLEGSISAPTQPLMLSMFTPTFIAGSGSSKGVSFKVLKSTGKIGYAIMFPGNKNVYGRGKYLASSPFGFVRNRKAKNTGLATRERENKSPRKNGKDPLTKLVTTSVMGAINKRETRQIIDAYLEDNIKKNLKTFLKKQLDNSQK